MKRIFGLVACLVILLLAAGCGGDKTVQQAEGKTEETKTGGKLIFAMNECFAPYTYSEGSESKGIEYEIFCEMLKRAGFKEEQYEIKAMPWARAKGLTLKDEIEGLIGASKDDEDGYFDYSTKPIDSLNVALYVRPNYNIN